MRFHYLAALTLLLGPGCAKQKEREAVLPPDSAIKPVLVLLTKDKTAQAPVLDYDGSVYFSHGKDIRIVTPNGRHRLWSFQPGPRGHRILPDGSHLVCDAARGAVLQLDSLGRRLETVARESEGHRLKSPTELALDPSNGFFFTDPGNPESATGALHYVTPGMRSRGWFGISLCRPDWRSLAMAPLSI